MSTSSTGAVGPVSVRYAAQIRHLLYTQAVHRMAADQEAARARTEAERSARTESTDKPGEPLDVKVTKPDPAADTAAPQAPADKPAPTGHLLDIQA